MKFIIFVTRNCKLNCDYCYEISITKNCDLNIKTADQTIDFILNRINNINDDNNVNILFHGGEPTLNMDIIKYFINKLKMLTTKKILFHTTTNGTFDVNYLTFLEKHFSSITFSIDGNKAMHGLNRKYNNGDNSYDISMKNALLYKSLGQTPRIRLTINRKNIEYVYDGILDLVNKGFDYIVPCLDFNENWKEVELNYLKKELLNLKKKINLSKVKISLLDTDCLASTKGDCFSLIYDYVIDYNGDIYPCVLLNGRKEYLVGNVKAYDQLYESYNYIKIMRILKEETNEECSECVRSDFCEGVRCKLINHYNTGKSSEPHRNTCMNEHFRYSLLEKILEEGN